MGHRQPGIQRREFIPLAAAATMLTMPACGSSAANGDWSVRDGQEPDIRRRVLQFARLAPNSHNAQPWHIEFASPTELRLFVDRNRLLPASDPEGRQIHVSQGTFLELLTIAASQFGYSAAIELFPDGEYTNTTIDHRPVASITLRPDRTITPDPLFTQILKRRSNKPAYEAGRPPSQQQLTAICAPLPDASLSWHIVTLETQREAIAEICTSAMAVEVSSVDRNREVARWFRFSDRELQAKRDGFGVAQNGTGAWKKWIAETLVLNRDRAADPKGAFAQSAVTMTQQQASSAPVFCALISSDNRRRTQVMAGRAYARADLAASQQGLAIHPLSQALQEYPQMTPLRRRLKQVLGVAEQETPQMLFRLGYAEPTPHTPRRTVDALLQEPQAPSAGTLPGRE